MKPRFKRTSYFFNKPFIFNGFAATIVSGAVFLSSSTCSFALPSGGSVVAGDATIQNNNNGLIINQTSDKAIIDWNKFGIANSETVQFIQNSISSVMLNRVTGNERSEIYGNLMANGKIFLINPNGILFGAGSNIDVAGLMATTLNVRNEDFMSGNTLTFTQDETAKFASVINEGNINITQEKGFVYLVAPNVENKGVIIAKVGKVALAAGTQATIDFTGEGLVNFAVSSEDTDDENYTASNEGRIEAKGGHVLLSGKSARNVMTSVVNNTGVIEASSFDDLTGGGSVKLEARNNKGSVTNSGTISVAGKGAANAGSINISGHKVTQNGALDASAEKVEASGGDVTIHAEGEFVLAGTINAFGNFVSSGGDFVMNTGSSLNVGNARIQITNIGNVTLSDLTADQISVTQADGIHVIGNVSAVSSCTLVAQTGSITSSDAGLIETTRLSLTTNGLNDASIGTITYSVDAGGNDVVTVVGLNIKVSELSASTQSGLVNGQSSGNIIINNLSNGDLTLNGITTNGDRGDNDIAAVIINSLGGKILGKGNGFDIDAFSASLTSGGDINVKTKINVLNAETKLSGSIFVNNESASLIILGAIAREYGNIAQVTSAGDVKALEVLEGENNSGSAIYHDGSKTVSITSTGNIGIQGDVSATGNVLIQSHNGSIVSYANNGILPTITSGTIDLHAAGSVGALGGSIQTITGSRLNISSGTIMENILSSGSQNGTDMKEVGGIYIKEMNRLNIGTIVATGSKGNVDLTLMGVNNVYFAHSDSSIIAREGNVNIYASNGNILTASQNSGIVIDAKSAHLEAKSIGSGTKSLQTKLTELTVISTDADRGCISINNSGNLSNINVTTPGVDVNIVSTGAILSFDKNSEFLSLINGINTSLSFSNSIGNIKLNGINVGGNNVELNAAKSILQQSGQLIANEAIITAGLNIGSQNSMLQVQVSSLDLTSYRNGIFVTQDGFSDLSVSAKASGSNSNIAIIQNGSGDMKISTISSTNGGIVLQSSGSILNNNGSASDVNIKGSSLSLSAAGGVGTSGKAIITNIAGTGLSSVYTVNTGNGGIYLQNTGAIDLNMSTANSGHIDFQNAGDVALGLIDAGAKNIKLTVDGKLTDANGDLNNIVAQNLNLHALSIASASDALDIMVDTIDVKTTNGGLYLRQLGNSNFYLASVSSAGSASIEAGKDIYLGVISAPSQSVLLKSLSGDIIDNRAQGETKSNITAKSLEIVANKIGTDLKPLSLDVDILNASSAGDVFAKNLGLLHVTADSLTGKGIGQMVSIVASSITVFDNKGGITTLDNNGSLKLVAEQGNIIFLNTEDTIAVTGSGSIYLEANGISGSPGESGLTGIIVAGNLQTDGGSITLKASSHISINLLNAGSGNVTVESKNGLIIDGNGDRVNIIGGNVVLSGKTLSDTQLDDDKKAAISFVGDQSLNLKLQEQLKQYSEDKMLSYEQLVSNYNNLVARAKALSESLKKQFEDKSSEADYLYQVFKGLEAAFDALNLAASILEIPAGAAQAIPLVGDGGAALALGIANSVLSGAELAANQAGRKADDAADDANSLNIQWTEAKSELYTNQQALVITKELLETETQIFKDLQNQVEKSEIALAAGKIIESISYQAAENNNVIGSSSQALGVQAENLDVSAFGQSNIYLESPGSLGVGTVTAHGKDTTIEITAKDNINLKGNASSSKNIVLYSQNGAITALNESNLVTDELVMIAKNGIGAANSSVNTSVSKLAAVTDNGSIYVANDKGNEALSIEEISVNTSNIIKTVSGVKAQDNISISTTDDLVINKSVHNVSKVGTVTLTSTNGSIEGSSENVLMDHVIGGNFVATAAEGLGSEATPLRTDVSTLVANVTHQGDINIIERNDIELTNVVVNDGYINIKAYGNIDAKNVVSRTDALGNTIALQAMNGNITAGTITAGANNGDIALLALAGQVNNDNDVLTRISGHNLIIQALSGIGVQGPNSTTSLDTDVFSIHANTQTGSIHLSELDDLDVKNLYTGNGDITVVSAQGDFNITTIHAAGTGNTVTLDAAGAIVDATDDEINAIIRANNILLMSANGIGSNANFIEIIANRLEATSTNLGIYINNISGDLEIGGVTPNLGKPSIDGIHATFGDIVVKTAGRLTVNEQIVSLDGDVFIVAQGGDITTNAVLTATTGKVDLDASGNIDINNTVNAGTDVDLTAGAGISLDGAITANDNILAMAQGGDIITTTALTATTGRVEMIAANGITLDGTITAQQDILATAQGGNILANQALASTIGKVDLDASGNIDINATVNAGTDVDLTAGLGISLDGEITANDNILATAQVGDITTTAALTATNGKVDLDASGNIDINNTVNAGTDVDLTAGAGISLDGEITANDNILATAQGGDITTTAALTATNGKVDLDASGNIDINNTVNAGTDVDLTAGAGISLDGAITANDNILATAQGGDITTTAALTATTGRVEMIAANGITLDGTITAQQDILATAQGGNIIANQALASTNGKVDMDASGNIDINNTVNAGTDVDLTAGLGISLDGAITANDNILATAQGGDITTTAALTAANGRVEMIAANGITLDGTITAQQDILATAQGGNIIANQALASTNGKVDMDASGNIDINNTVNAGTDVDLTAGLGISLDGAITANDNILATAQGGDITTTAALTAANGRVEMIAANGITLDGTITAQQDILATAQGGNIIANQALASTTGKVDMDASGSIDINNTVNAGTDVDLNAGLGISLDGAITANNNILATAQGGDITTTAIITAITGGINLNAAYDISLGETLHAQNGVVSLTATEGSIMGAADNPPHYHVIAKFLEATAAYGIGSNEVSLRTQIEKLVAHVTSQGNVAIDQNGDLEASVITQDGSIQLTSDSDILAKEIISITDNDLNDIIITSINGDITVNHIQAGQGVASDIILSAANGHVQMAGPDAKPLVGDQLNVTAKSGIDLITEVNGANVLVTDNGNISIEEKDDLIINKAQIEGVGHISVSAGGSLQALDVITQNGSIDLTAKNDLIAMSVKALTNSQMNNINLTSTHGDIVVDSVIAGIGTGGDVVLTSQTGQIRVYAQKTAHTNIVGNHITLVAKGDIGAGNVLKIDGEMLSAYTAEGSMFISENDDIIIHELHSAKGNIAISANGSIMDDNDNETKIIAKDLVLEAGTGIGNKGADLTKALDIKVDSLVARVLQSGDINLDQEGDLLVNRVTNSNGDVNLNVKGNIYVDYIGTDTDGNSVRLKAENGAIIDANDRNGEHLVNIKTDKVYLNADLGVGGKGNPLEIMASELTAHGGSGGLHITNLKEGLIVNGYTTEYGDLVLATPGQIIINSPIINLGGGDISLTSTDTGRSNDDIILNSEFQVAGNGSIYINADDSFYQNANLSVNNMGNIGVQAGDSIYMANGTVSQAQSGSITYQSQNIIELGQLITNILPHGGIVVVDASTIRTNNSVGIPSIKASYIHVKVKENANKNLVWDLVGHEDKTSYAIWLNSRLVGGLLSRDATFISEPRFKNSLHDLGYELYYNNQRTRVNTIDSSVYKRKGFIYDASSKQWVYLP